MGRWTMALEIIWSTPFHTSKETEPWQPMRSPMATEFILLRISIPAKAPPSILPDKGTRNQRNTPKMPVTTHPPTWSNQSPAGHLQCPFHSPASSLKQVVTTICSIPNSSQASALDPWSQSLSRPQLKWSFQNSEFAHIYPPSKSFSGPREKPQILTITKPAWLGSQGCPRTIPHANSPVQATLINPLSIFQIHLVPFCPTAFPRMLLSLWKVLFHSSFDCPSGFGGVPFLRESFSDPQHWVSPWCLKLS